MAISSEGGRVVEGPTGRADATAAAVVEGQGIGARSGVGTTVAPTRVTTRGLKGTDVPGPIGCS